MKIVAIIQARMTSTRLPGKVMMPVLGISLLEHQINRLKRAKLITSICIACTENDQDEPIVNMANNLGVFLHRGSEFDVLSRYYEAALDLKADLIMRVTSDCPLIDPVELDKLVTSYFLDNSDCDYLSTGLIRSYPRGMDAELFSFNALKIAYEKAKEPYQREHVTPYFYHNPNDFKVKNFSFKEDQSKHRWTVDTLEDFELISKIIAELYPLNPNFTIYNVLSLLEKNPEWVSINQHVRQKDVKE
jgi:spore coat polysaccharide biosynthesis protein SpsF